MKTIQWGIVMLILALAYSRYETNQKLQEITIKLEEIDARANDHDGATSASLIEVLDNIDKKCNR